ncbi:MAG: hypothetical protein CL920_37640 [Deltaproteobacteria bacterium]|nr:hypothetical protein [Deltaproteobacteria bacterium]MBU54455.1 hypothetical protein [Deltaproteobacteria bacterium]|tara:strand:- start:2754 stop:3473 length:720 start_codon:yes stop_codon:yes gene_type:complete
MLQLIAKGGWVIYLIILGSVIGLTIFFERLWALRRSKVCPDDLVKQLQILINKREWVDAKTRCQRDDSSLARIMWAVLSQLDQGHTRAEMKEIAEEAGQREAFFMERGIGSLGVVASLEPLMGLLGTVLGMIIAFRRVAESGVGDPRLVAGGVWAALLTTAAGLIVAIPAYIGYRYLLSRFDRLLIDLQNDVSVLVEGIYQQNALETESPKFQKRTVPEEEPLPLAPPETLPSVGGESP